jgi:hypothetical protein
MHDFEGDVSWAKRNLPLDLTCSLSARTAATIGLSKISSTVAVACSSRAEALRFALFENGHQPEAVVVVPGIFELDMSGNASIVDQMSPPVARFERQAA